MAEVGEVGVGINGGNCEDKTVKRLPSKNLNQATDYLTLKVRLAFTELRKTFT